MFRFFVLIVPFVSKCEVKMVQKTLLGHVLTCQSRKTCECMCLVLVLKQIPKAFGRCVLNLSQLEQTRSTTRPTLSILAGLQPTLSDLGQIKEYSSSPCLHRILSSSYQELCKQPRSLIRYVACLQSCRMAARFVCLLCGVAS